MGPPWWTPFGRYRLVDLSTGRVIARSHDDEDLGRRGERLAYRSSAVRVWKRNPGGAAVNPHTAAVAYEWIYFGAIIVTLVIAFFETTN
jgi:hypothetical protein